MHPDAAQLKAFYGSPLGQLTRRLVLRRLREFWPDVSGLRVAGIGFASPYLPVFADEAQRTVAFMPGALGAAHWPDDEPNRAALVDEGMLPVPDSIFDRVLIVHALETTDSVRDLLRCVWRAVAPAGRVIIVAPNRTSLWTLTEATPFGHGHPYTLGQLHRLLESAMFTPEQTGTALAMPPFRSAMMVRSGLAWERAGRAWCPGLSGALIVEATKLVHAPVKGRPVRALQPLRIPVTGPAVPAATREG